MVLPVLLVKEIMDYLFSLGLLECSRPISFDYVTEKIGSLLIP